jgi:type VI protein secretion system component VasF
MSTARPPDYLETEQIRDIRRRMLLAWVVALFSLLIWIVVYEAWHVLLALMVMHVMVR